MPSTLRFLRQLLVPDPGAVTRDETSYERAGERLPASLYRPARDTGAGPLPGWVALHGITYRGREHESLISFARALAGSGTAVLVPDVPEWRALRVAPATAVETIRAAVLELDGRPVTAPGRVGVIGFSFGGTHALIASTDPGLDGHLAAVASWGAYAGMRRAVRFGFLGEHELDSEAHHLDPDPYGRWILAGNYLTTIPEHRDAGAAAEALLGLAREVGRRKIMAWEPATDALKREARAALGSDDRALFDLIAPPTDADRSPAERRQLAALADRLAESSVAAEPLLDPAPRLDRVAVPVFLAHGRDDRLIPWSELVRLRRLLPDDVVRHAFVTRIFAHSFRERRFPSPVLLVEAVRFIRGIRRMIRLI